MIYLSLHCHQQNDSCIKMGSDESHFNVSLSVRDKVTRQCPQTTTFYLVYFGLVEKLLKHQLTYLHSRPFYRCLGASILMLVQA